VIFAFGEGALKAILAKPLPAVPTTLLGAVGTAACAIAGRKESRVAVSIVETIRRFPFALTCEIIV
jgi:CRISPR/Cas system-associated protein Cas5 (RAMP superfamily)